MIIAGPARYLYRLTAITPGLQQFPSGHDRVSWDDIITKGLIWHKLFNVPLRLEASDEPNNHSIVLHLQYGQVSFLLPGDIEAPVERRLVQTQAPLAATVLKSPHHGSKTSSGEAFLEAVDPQVVVVSVGKDNRFGHPTPEVMERYAEHGLPVLRTDERGTIEFVTDGERLWVETGR